MKPPSLAASLDEAVALLPIALDAVQRDKLVSYVGLLEKWNRTYNLTAVREPLAMMQQHVVDCLAVAPSLQRHLQGTSGPRLLDVGSGAGLPGLVLAIAMPGLEVVCIDSVGKKASFIAHATTSLQIANAAAHHARVESFESAPFHVVACRALTALAPFVSMTDSLLAPTGHWMAMKGTNPVSELASLGTDVTFHVEHLLVPRSSAARCIVWLQRSVVSECPLTGSVPS